MKKLIWIGLVAVASAAAEDAVTKNLRAHVTTYKENILASMEKVPAADFSFKPAGDVMSFQEMLGHLTDANYSICAPLKNEANPDAGGNAKKHTEKAVLLAALGKSFDYCLEAVSMSDGKLAEQTKARAPRDKAWVALHILDHNALHYGNLITYMRIRGLVPVETERRMQAAPKK
jgi:uncharacterized damage-inducible protein DinB